MLKRNIVSLFALILAAFAGGLAVSSAGAAEGAVVSITSPNYDSVYVLGDSIVFSCSVKSAAGIDIPGIKVIWTSQLDGKMGEGVLLKNSTLTLGIHRITVEAYDAKGASLGAASIKLKVAQSKAAEDGAKSAAPVGVGKSEPYLVNPFN